MKNITAERFPKIIGLPSQRISFQFYLKSSFDRNPLVVGDYRDAQKWNHSEYKGGERDQDDRVHTKRRNRKSPKAEDSEYTHIPLRMLPTQVVEKKIKCIQIIRNPKDVCVSFFHHKRDTLSSIGYDGDFLEFTEAFLSGKLPFGSYYNYLLTWQKETAREPSLPVLTLHYEDMKLDPIKCIRDIATFLNLTVTDTFCKGIAEACSFDKMKQFDKEEKHKPFSLWKEGSGGSFYRKGEVGDWKNWFTVAENEKFDYIWNAKMDGSGIQFMYTL